MIKTENTVKKGSSAPILVEKGKKKDKKKKGGK